MTKKWKDIINCVTPACYEAGGNNQLSRSPGWGHRGTDWSNCLYVNSNFCRVPMKALNYVGPRRRGPRGGTRETWSTGVRSAWTQCAECVCVYQQGWMLRLLCVCVCVCVCSGTCVCTVWLNQGLLCTCRRLQCFPVSLRVNAHACMHARVCVCVCVCV